MTIKAHNTHAGRAKASADKYHADRQEREDEGVDLARRNYSDLLQQILDAAAEGQYDYKIMIRENSKSTLLSYIDSAYARALRHLFVPDGFKCEPVKYNGIQLYHHYLRISW